MDLLLDFCQILHLLLNANVHWYQNNFSYNSVLISGPLPGYILKSPPLIITLPPEFPVKSIIHYSANMARARLRIILLGFLFPYGAAASILP